MNQSQPMIITQMLGPAKVVIFVVAYKVISLPLDLICIANQPVYRPFRLPPMQVAMCSAIQNHARCRILRESTLYPDAWFILPLSQVCGSIARSWLPGGKWSKCPTAIRGELRASKVRRCDGSQRS